MSSTNNNNEPPLPDGEEEEEGKREGTLAMQQEGVVDDDAVVSSTTTPPSTAEDVTNEQNKFTEKNSGDSDEDSSSSSSSSSSDPMPTNQASTIGGGSSHRRSRSPGMNTSARMIEKRHKRSSGKDLMRNKQTTKSSSDHTTGTNTTANMETIEGEQQGALRNKSQHLSDSHIHFHARKQQNKHNDEWLDDNSDFSLSFRHEIRSPQRSVEIVRKEKEGEESGGMLSQHLQQGGGSSNNNEPRGSGGGQYRPSPNESISSIPISRTTSADKSASSTMFPAHPYHQRVDQRVNLMDSHTGIYFETGSHGSGSQSGASKGSRGSSSSRAGERLNAPGRPGKYASKANVPKKDDPSALSMNASIMEFLSMVSSGRGKQERRLSESTSGETEESEATVRRRGSTEKYKKKRARKNDTKEGPRSYRWEIGILVIFLAGAATVVLISPSFSGRMMHKEASKSSVGNVNEAPIDTYRDGEEVWPSLSLSTHNALKMTTNTPDVGTSSTMSDFTKQMKVQHQKLSELSALVIQHGISMPETLKGWKKYHYDYDDFTSFSPQTKALIWLAQDDMHPTSALERDIQHHKLLTRYALAVFYYSTSSGSFLFLERLDTGHYHPTTPLLRLQQEPSWIRSDGWLSNDSVCSWYGIHCKSNIPNDEVIISLNLTHNGLKGTLPIQELTRTLRWELCGLDLSGNDLFGTIGLSHNKTSTRHYDQDHSVDEWFSWPHLQYLRLQDNRLTGSIPLHWLLGCPMMAEIDLSGNEFNGSLPDHAFELLDNLRTLQLDHNKLTGNVPALDHLRRLELLDLQQNYFVGQLPIGIFMLTTLVELRTADNRFTGIVSTELVNMIDLEVLSLENNHLEGLVPDVFYTMPNMIQLLLFGNNFTGSLPESLGAMERLEALAVDHNSFTGTVPSVLSQLTNLETLLLSHNNLTGSFPAAICSLKEGFFHFKKLRHIGVDCSQVECSCCDGCH